MEAKKVFFDPCPTVAYKVYSLVDPTQVLTLQPGTNKLILDTYKAAPNQLFHVYNDNLKYAFVNVASNLGLHIEGENQGDGGVIKGDPAPHPSSYFTIEPITQGKHAGRACYIKTFAAEKALDILGGKCIPGNPVAQWKFHGGDNQTWAITPAD